MLLLAHLMLLPPVGSQIKKQLPHGTLVLAMRHQGLAEMKVADVAGGKPSGVGFKLGAEPWCSLYTLWENCPSCEQKSFLDDLRRFIFRRGLM